MSIPRCLLLLIMLTSLAAWSAQCVKCKAVIPDGAKFCHECGVKVEATSPRPPAQPEGMKPWERQGAKAGEVIIGPDGGLYAWIPRGSFRMGTSTQQVDEWLKSYPTAKRAWFASEQPEHTVMLDGFWMSVTIVTVAQYRQFCTAMRQPMPPPPSWGWVDTHPMVNITWKMATAYAQWIGGNLPTEAQWQYAAHGGGERLFVWGDSWPPPTGAANYADQTYSDAGDHPRPAIIDKYTDGYAHTAPVTTYPPNSLGLHDMAGNVWQWCADWYGEGYYRESPAKNPTGPATGDYRIYCGGSWKDSEPRILRIAYRRYISPDEWNETIGFRCVIVPAPIRDPSMSIRGRRGQQYAPGMTPQSLGWGENSTAYPDLFVINPTDGAELTWIPQGGASMGLSVQQLDDWLKIHPNDRRERFTDEQPRHQVTLDGCWMATTTVTVAQYRQFCAATGQAMPPPPAWGWIDSHPMVNITWNNANAYSRWAGGSLPTEAQWEYAARGGDDRLFVWGDAWPPPANAGNLADQTCKDTNKYPRWKFIDGYTDGYAATAPVGSFVPNGYGLFDMTGNVWQLCADWYGAEYYKDCPSKNPTGPVAGENRVSRGSPWVEFDPKKIRISCRQMVWPDEKSDNLGFRYVISAPGQ